MATCRTGHNSGGHDISRGELDIRADTELPRRDTTLQDRAQKIILTCGSGGKVALCAEILAEMGFEDVWVIKGGCSARSAAGYPLVALHNSPASQR